VKNRFKPYNREKPLQADHRFAIGSLFAVSERAHPAAGTMRWSLALLGFAWPSLLTAVATAVGLGWLDGSSRLGQITSIVAMPVTAFFSAVCGYYLGRDHDIGRASPADESLIREELRLLRTREELLGRLLELSSESARLEAEETTRTPAT
jgi:hypothetical protein